MKGVTLNGNGHLDKYKENKGSFITIVHCTNVTIKNVTMKNGMDLHYVGVAGVDGFTMSGCEIYGLDSKSATDTAKKDIEIQLAYSKSVISLNEELAQKCIHAKSLFLRCVHFPLYPRLTHNEVAKIVKVLGSLP